MYPYNVIYINYEDHIVETVATFAHYSDAYAHCKAAIKGWTFAASTYLIFENNVIVHSETFIPSVE